MTTVINDLKSILAAIKKPTLWLMSLFGRVKDLIKGIHRARKIVDEIDYPIAQDDEKVGIFARINNIIRPRAKLTYWLADEEVIVYVSEFKQKDKFKLVYKELETGRTVMVNPAAPINYRLEELKANDKTEKTEIQQNQRY
jgi:hypothetical protein